MSCWTIFGYYYIDCMAKLRIQWWTKC